jgi:hypothetical protein
VIYLKEDIGFPRTLLPREEQRSDLCGVLLSRGVCLKQKKLQSKTLKLFNHGAEGRNCKTDNDINNLLK